MGKKYEMETNSVSTIRNNWNGKSAEKEVKLTTYLFIGSILYGIAFFDIEYYMICQKSNIVNRDMERWK